MTREAPTLDLTGKVLIAMPGMADRRFERSVVYLCAHSATGAMGLIVNKPRVDISVASLMQQLSIPTSGIAAPPAAHFGGPVEATRGFVLHSTDYPAGKGTIVVCADIAMTATPDILRAIGAGRGPGRYLLALGYAGWAAGQLESEIMQNGWLTADVAPDLVFGSANGGKWEAALKSLGIDPLSLSAAAGRA